MMTELPKRKPNRLPLYDYGQSGTYFLTICTHEKQKLFWKNCRDNPCGCPNDPPVIEYTPLGEIAVATIKFIEEKYPVKIENSVVMPNHIHLLIFIDNDIAYEAKRTTARVVPTKITVPQIVGAYKSLVATQYSKLCRQNNMPIEKIWQRSYYDHIIRSEKDYSKIWDYIDGNPSEWTKDKYF